MRSPLDSSGLWRAGFRTAHGWRTVREPRGPYATASMLEWGSIMKGLVGTTAWLTVEIERPVAHYLPSVPDAEMTVGDLIHHTSGLPRLPAMMRNRLFADPCRSLPLRRLGARARRWALPHGELAAGRGIGLDQRRGEDSRRSHRQRGRSHHRGPRAREGVARDRQDRHGAHPAGRAARAGRWEVTPVPTRPVGRTEAAPPGRIESRARGGRNANGGSTPSGREPPWCLAVVSVPTGLRRRRALPARCPPRRTARRACPAQHPAPAEPCRSWSWG
ncbi:beta-lactamase [Curtobacterium sp. ZW137]|nr:beta-lactamase [Curtobacterium sp. ZW137]